MEIEKKIPAVKNPLNNMSIEELEDLGDKMLGLKLLIECHGRSYCGVVKHFFEDSRRIWFEKASILPLGTPLHTVLTLFCHDIKTVSIIDVDQSVRKRLLKEIAAKEKRAKKLQMKRVDPQLSAGSGSEDEFEEMSPIEEESYELLPPPDPYANCSRPTEKYIINSDDQEFVNAIAELKKENVIAIVARGLSLGRRGNLAWLAMATSQVMFCFDISNIGIEKVLHEGLASIFEDQGKIKIIHDARSLEDYLHHKYYINLANVFDTQATDIYMEMCNNKGKAPCLTRDLPIILMHMLNFEEAQIPPLYMAVSDESLWLERPLSNNLLESLHFSIMFLRELRQVMLDSVLKNLQHLTHLFVSSIKHLDSLAAHKIDQLIVPQEVQKLGQAVTAHIIKYKRHDQSGT